MADTFKILAQSAPAATTLTDIYTVPGSTSTTISSAVICNRSASAITFRLSVAIAGAADTNAQYLYYDQSVDANSTFIATIGMTLATTDKVRAYVSAATVSVNLFGVEVT